MAGDELDATPLRASGELGAAPRGELDAAPLRASDGRDEACPPLMASDELAAAPLRASIELELAPPRAAREWSRATPQWVRSGGRDDGGGVDAAAVE